MREFLSLAKALSDPNRARALVALGAGELCVCQIAELLGLAASTVSKHLSVLEQARLVERRKKGRWVYYRRSREGAQEAVGNALRWLDEATKTDPTVAADGARLREILEVPVAQLCKTGEGRMKVLFLCTGNSCRSQMAEGWVRALRRSELEPFSAGIEATGLDARAVAVMAEAGVDISGQHWKSLGDLDGESFDVVVTVCDSARESCPVFPGHTRTVHASFDDPPALAQTAADEEEALGHYRRVRDEIKAFVETLPGALAPGDEA